MSADHVDDPLEVLAEPEVPLAPAPVFAAALRRRLEARFGHTVPTTSEEDTMTSTTDSSVTPPVTTLAPLVPYLTCAPAAEAVDWYGRVLGAVVVGEVYPMGPDQPDSIGHAELRIGDSSIYLSDEHVPVGAVAPTTLGGSTTAFVLIVPDVDAVYQRAVDAGAAADRPPVDQPYGSRAGWFTDPFGHRWSIQTPLGGDEPTE